MIETKRNNSIFMFFQLHKLSTTNEYVRNTKYMHLPLLDTKDPCDPVRVIHRYIKKLSPGQLHLFCRLVSKVQMARFAVCV